MQVIFTNNLGAQGLLLVPETKTEENYLCDLDRDSLRLVLRKTPNGAMLETTLVEPANHVKGR